jgi:hypothetical protein
VRSEWIHLCSTTGGGFTGSPRSSSIKPHTISSANRHHGFILSGGLG